MDFPSLFQINEKAIFKFAHHSEIPCIIVGVSFSESKVKYDLDIYSIDDPDNNIISRINDVDSVFVKQI